MLPKTVIPPKVARVLDEPDAVLAHQGSIIATWRTYKGRHTGPYYRLMYRRDGRLRSVYLGHDQEVVTTVQAELDSLKEPGRRRQEFAQLRRQIKRSLASQKDQFRARLRRQGRDLKGFEVRHFHQQHVQNVGDQTYPKEGNNDGQERPEELDRG